MTFLVFDDEWDEPWGEHCPTREVTADDITNEMVERVAKAICEAEESGPGITDPWNHLGGDGEAGYLFMARGALTALFKDPA